MPDIYHDRPCMDCGKIVRMHIKSKRCKECQAKADRRNNAAHKRAKAKGQTRELGSNDLCVVCGKTYIVYGGQQKYCPACAPSATKAADSKATLAWIQATYTKEPEKREERNAKRRKDWKNLPRECVICKEHFLPPTTRRKTCSDACQEEYHRQQQRAYDAKRNKARYQERKKAFDALPADERMKKQDEINRKARENYAKRKSKEDKQ